ncbi:hypothetical protein HBH49_126470 [Parastagonospora nodorum]|nr:hypothetical protein HBH49_126470 [Parastagonospora nodorum]
MFANCFVRVLHAFSNFIVPTFPKMEFPAKFAVNRPPGRYIVCVMDLIANNLHWMLRVSVMEYSGYR